MPDPLLRMSTVRAGYDGARPGWDRPVISDFDLEVGAGELVTLLGANGSGKSCVLLATAGLLRLTGGTISIDGEDVTRSSASDRARAGISLVPEGRRVFATLTVEDNLLVGAHTRGGRREVEADLERWYDAFPKLAELRHRPAGVLSGGEQQMLALARALMSRPKVLLLDEPSLGLAPKIVARVFEFVDRIRSEGTAVVLVEQNARLALECADRAIVMQRGRIALQGPASELAVDPRVRDVYLGRNGGPS